MLTRTYKQFRVTHHEADVRPMCALLVLRHVLDFGVSAYFVTVGGLRLNEYLVAG